MIADKFGSLALRAGGTALGYNARNTEQAVAGALLRDAGRSMQFSKPGNCQNQTSETEYERLQRTEYNLDKIELDNQLSSHGLSSVVICQGIDEAYCATRTFESVNMLLKPSPNVSINSDGSANFVIASYVDSGLGGLVGSSSNSTLVLQIMDPENRFLDSCYTVIPGKTCGWRFHRARLDNALQGQYKVTVTYDPNILKPGNEMQKTEYFNLR
jgi:hypothetical protein